MFIAEDAVLDADNEDSAQQKNHERQIILQGIAFHFHCWIVAILMPFIKVIIRRNNSHHRHHLQTEVHVDVEESHVANQVEVKAFEAVNYRNSNHGSEAKE